MKNLQKLCQSFPATFYYQFWPVLQTNSITKYTKKQKIHTQIMLKQQKTHTQNIEKTQKGTPKTY